MPGHLRTGGYLRHVQPIALRDGITEWAHTFFQEEDSVIKYLFLKRRTRSTSSLRPSLRGSLTVPSSSSRTTSTDYWAVVQAYFVRRFATGTRFPGVRLLALPVLRKYPWPLRRSRGDGNGRPLLPSFFRHSMCVRADLAALDR